MGLLRLFDNDQVVNAAAALVTNMLTGNTLVLVNMNAATGEQTVRLPAANYFPGEVCAVVVNGAVAVHMVVIQDGAGGAVDAFNALTNGSRMYTWSGTAWIRMRSDF